MNWFKRLCLPPEYRSMTLATLRRDLPMLPGELVRTENVSTFVFRHRKPSPKFIQHVIDPICKVKS
jgi:hypothetical protein